MNSVADLINAAAVRRFAGAGSYERGVGYHYDGRVEQPIERNGRLRALVRGTVPYVIELWADEGTIRWSCTCPAAEDGSFCKHCVAVALAALSARDGPSDTAAHAHELQTLRAGTHRRRAVGSSSAPRRSNWIRRIDRAFFGHGEFVSYYEAEAWADGIHVMVEHLENLCDAGHPDAVAELAEHAFGCAEEAINYVDDSDGHLTGIIERLSELHLRACAYGSAEGDELAARLVKLELRSELDGFHRAAARYADVLGESGLAEYRRVLEPRWHAIKPTDDPYGAAFRIRQAMVGWALATGDPEAIIEAHSSDRMTPDDVLDIAVALERSGRTDEAVSWAKRGIADCRGRPRLADGLRKFLARLLREQGELAAAVELFWQAFTAEPSVERYRELLHRAPDNDWLARCRDELERALARRAEAASRTPPTTTGSPLHTQLPVPRTATALEEILLFEGLTDEAWEAAVGHGCSPHLRLTLARAREKTHPLDAVAVYEAQAAEIIDRKRPDRYRDAVDLMERIRELAGTAGEPERFTSFLRQVRTDHRLKRRLMAELDQRSWG